MFLSSTRLLHEKKVVKNASNPLQIDTSAQA